MNTRALLSLFALSTLNLQLSTPARAQGSLTPPAGPPVASMKTLDQVEARTPLVAGAPGVSINAAGTITISQPGSYYLTGNRTYTTAGAHGIVVSSNEVTLDLNGYSLICTSVLGGDAIDVTSGYGGRLVLRNGNLIGDSRFGGGVWTLNGWNSGLDIDLTGALVQDVTVYGVRDRGLYNGSLNGSTIERCTAIQVRQEGIYASRVIDCTVRNCGAAAIGVPAGGGVVSRCFISGGQNDGILGGSRSTVSDCTVSCSGIGIECGSVTNCSVDTTTGIGISAGNVSNCRAVSVSGHGISAPTISNSIGVSASGIGLSGNMAINCQGESTTGTAGISLTGTASYCRGQRTGGTAINAAIAIGCTAGAGTITAPQKHLGTP